MLRLAVPLLVWLAQAPAWAQDVQLAGLSGGKALLVINGEAPRFLSPGQTVGGVKLIELSAQGAEVDVAGERRSLRLGHAHRGDALHRFAQPLLPQLTVGIEHDLDGLGVIQSCKQFWPHVPFELLLCPISNSVVLLTMVCHDVCPVLRCSFCTLG